MDQTHGAPAKFYSQEHVVTAGNPSRPLATLTNAGLRSRKQSQRGAADEQRTVLGNAYLQSAHLPPSHRPPDSACSRCSVRTPIALGRDFNFTYIQPRARSRNVQREMRQPFLWVQQHCRNLGDHACCSTDSSCGSAVRLNPRLYVPRPCPLDSPDFQGLPLLDGCRALQNHRDVIRCPTSSTLEIRKMACRQSRPHLGRHEGYAREVPKLHTEIEPAARMRCVRQEGDGKAAQCVCCKHASQTCSAVPACRTQQNLRMHRMGCPQL